MSYVGLDLATRAGVAIWSEGAAAPSLATLHLAGDAECVDRPMETLRRYLADLHSVDPISHLFFEVTILPHGRTTMATVYKLCALAGMAEWFGYRVGAATRSVEQQRWRKHFLGRGTGRSEELKRLAIDACRMRGWNPQNDHEADAAGVLDFGLHCFGVKVPWRDAHMFGGKLGSIAA